MGGRIGSDIAFCWGQEICSPKEFVLMWNDKLLYPWNQEWKREVANHKEGCIKLQMGNKHNFLCFCHGFLWLNAERKYDSLNAQALTFLC